MAKSRKKARAHKKREKPKKEETVQRTWCRPDVQKEVAYITIRAQQGDARLVSLGVLVFFSTPSRDAWLLDAEDNFSLCLVRDGVPQPVRIIDNSKTFTIQWEGKFQINGDLFITGRPSGQVVTIQGYPTQAIREALDRTIVKQKENRT
jgi:hypothetical protein